MYKVRSGEYGKLLVSNEKKHFSIHLKTQLGDLLVYRKRWLHFGRWIIDYWKIAREQKAVMKEINKQLKKKSIQLNKDIKKAYGLDN